MTEQTCRKLRTNLSPIPSGIRRHDAGVSRLTYHLADIVIFKQSTSKLDLLVQTSLGADKMRYAAITHAWSTSLARTKGFARAMTVAATLGLTWSGLAGLGLVGGAGLVMGIATPAHASCLIAGVPRNDISDVNCLEAQRTGCVRNMLTPMQYSNCLAANRNKRASCVINGQVRDDLSPLDCEEANATGCVRRLLSPVQYKNCLDAQPVRR
jgi:hypothetical protein